MPVYEYRCEHCGDFEEMQRITDPPLSRCPKCRRKVRRLISNTSFQLKGSGWYVTDYARSGDSKKGKKDDGGDKSTSETKTESASKTEPAKADKADTGKAKSKADAKAESKPTSTATAGA